MPPMDGRVQGEPLVPGDGGDQRGNVVGDGGDRLGDEASVREPGGHLNDVVVGQEGQQAVVAQVDDAGDLLGAGDGQDQLDRRLGVERAAAALERGRLGVDLRVGVEASNSSSMALTASARVGSRSCSASTSSCA